MQRRVCAGCGIHEPPINTEVGEGSASLPRMGGGVLPQVIALQSFGDPRKGEKGKVRSGMVREEDGEGFHKQNANNPRKEAETHLIGAVSRGEGEKNL